MLDRDKKRKHIACSRASHVDKTGEKGAVVNRTHSLGR